MIFRKGLLPLLLCLVFTSCEKNDPEGHEVDNPTYYSFERSGVSTVSFSGQTTRIQMATELIDALKDFTINSEVLKEMYANQTNSGAAANPFENPILNESSKSIKSKVAASADLFSSNSAESAKIKGDIELWLEKQVSEIFPKSTDIAERGVAGQIADGTSVRYVSDKGLEYNQAVNKSLIGALMVDQICNNYLSQAVLDAGNNRRNNSLEVTENEKVYTTMEHKWDEAYGYLFGLSTDPANPLATLGEDSFLNKYLAKVDNDPDFQGIANDIFQAFKLGRAAIVAGNYELRDDQVKLLRDKIAQIIAIRAVYYLQISKIALANGNYGSAFHDLSEGYGFVYSLRFLQRGSNNAQYFSHSEVEGFLNQLMEGNGFWDVSPSTLDIISHEIASKLSFTTAQALD